ncbi:MAG: hypothetical protein U9N77_08510, partial [Thermodesulfobacteriota bacterium]|nr:hypothetical protein [Thermodesulfobacteriota bacterium]
ALTDSNMKSVTGQAGVSIAIDDVVIYQEGIADVTYRDTDGVATCTTYGSLEGNVIDAGIMLDYDDHTKKLITINALTDVAGNASDYSVSALNTTFGLATYSADDTIGFSQTNVVNSTTGYIAEGFIGGSSPLTIDVGTCSNLTEGLNNNATAGTPFASAEVAGVVIGLPTLEITTYHTDDIMNVRIVSTNAAAANADASYIQIEKTGYSKMAILGGVLEIAPH